MKNPAVSVSYGKGTDEIQLTLNAGKTAVLSGNWKSNITFDGTRLLPEGNWEETCTHNENGCDFLEIDLLLTENYRLQRFFLLDRKDKFLLLGDTVLWDGEENKKTKKILTYSASLPLSDNLQLLKTSKSGAMIYGNQKEKVCRLFPLFASGLGNNFTAIQQGHSLFAAFCVDLNPQRFDTDCIWKPLTVGEDRQKVSADKAAAYYFRLGEQGFLLYRSMTEFANRTFLGHNLIDDFCFAKFDAVKGVEGLIEVQTEE